MRWLVVMMLVAAPQLAAAEPCAPRAAFGTAPPQARIWAVDSAPLVAVERCEREDVIPVALLSPPAQGHIPGARDPWLVFCFLLALHLGGLLVVAPELRKRWRRSREAPAVLGLDTARVLARTAGQAALVRGGVALAAGGTALVVASSVVTAFAVLVALLVVARQAWVIVRAQRILELLELEPTVTLQNTQVLSVRARGDTLDLVCSPRLVARAMARALPVARVV